MKFEISNSENCTSYETAPVAARDQHLTSNIQHPRKQAVRAYAVTLALAGAWLAIIAAAPLLAASGEHFAANLIYRSLQRFCHQIAERSFHLQDFPLAVCARCTGIYVGYVAGLLVYPLARRLTDEETPARGWLLAALLPMAIDVAGDFAGIFSNTHLSRAATGAVAGFAGAFFTLPGLVSLARAWGAKSVRRAPKLPSPS